MFTNFLCLIYHRGSGLVSQRILCSTASEAIKLAAAWRANGYTARAVFVAVDADALTARQYRLF